MLTMPNVSSTPVAVPRPSLVVEAVRPVATPRAIEPTTAVSKERSRAESSVPDSSSAVSAVVYTQQGAVPKRLERGSSVPAQVAPQEAAPREEPPAEKSEIQKAMETQIKDLLSNVWKASAKAVDFLLQRQSQAEQSQKLPGALEAAAILGSGANSKLVIKPSGLPNPAAGAKSEPGTVSYSPQGGRLSERTVSAGQLIDVLA
jgi:hypothetical protein